MSEPPLDPPAVSQLGAHPRQPEAVGSVSPSPSVYAEQPARRRIALSPSRAGDFKQCPLLYRFRTIDRLPEPPSLAAVRGTLVHAVLEQMFGKPRQHRNPQMATADIAPTWERLSAENTHWLQMFDQQDLGEWLDSARALVETYFTLEDPTRFDPESAEMLLEIEISGVPLRGYVDRIDVAPTGQVRIVDYKTGSAPREAYENKAIYQLKFYALMLWRLRGTLPTQLKLLYLGNAQPLIYSPDESEMVAFEQGIRALWAAISSAIVTGDFQPRKSGLCPWCSHQSLCPEFGGTPPPYPGPPLGFLEPTACP
ncbi:RecB family exonuclease [Nakamurella antarctica]|uniref:RecB family exonuclease n=1 Tax=Nakamurella antarctica TaxID=1902245 RepID=A0A3G8ZM94_9ACTN|nr:RecB family exonuclease [Nakamurella antarctica]AZI57907.1 RecB family exonuclease [Nakamurella antarctica]